MKQCDKDQRSYAFFVDGMFYKALELMVSENVQNNLLLLTLIHPLYVLPVGRQDFGSVNPEIQIIEGQIIEVLLYIASFTFTIISSLLVGMVLK